jgi:hypothetical protein
MDVAARVVGGRTRWGLLGPNLEDAAGWGGRIRTCECRYQKPVPYHLATPQQAKRGLIAACALR